jgi:hypothetical protein
LLRLGFLSPRIIEAIAEGRQPPDLTVFSLMCRVTAGHPQGQPAFRRSGVKVLRHTAQINGYSAPQRHELTGKDGKPLTLVQLLEAIGPIGDEE